MKTPMTMNAAVATRQATFRRTVSTETNTQRRSRRVARTDRQDGDERIQRIHHAGPDGEGDQHDAGALCASMSNVTAQRLAGKRSRRPEGNGRCAHQEDKAEPVDCGTPLFKLDVPLVVFAGGGPQQGRAVVHECRSRWHSSGRSQQLQISEIFSTYTCYSTENGGAPR